MSNFTKIRVVYRQTDTTKLIFAELYVYHPAVLIKAILWY